MARLGIKPRTPDLRVWCPTNCGTGPAYPFSLIIQTQHANANFLQSDRSTASRSWLLYMDKPPEPEFRSYMNFLCGDTQYNREYSVIDDQVKIIKMKFIFVDFIDATHSLT